MRSNRPHESRWWRAIPGGRSTAARSGAPGRLSDPAERQRRDRDAELGRCKVGVEIVDGGSPPAYWGAAAIPPAPPHPYSARRAASKGQSPAPEQSGSTAGRCSPAAPPPPAVARVNRFRQSLAMPIPLRGAQSLPFVLAPTLGGLVFGWIGAAARYRDRQDALAGWRGLLSRVW